MAASFKHTFTSPIADDLDPTLVGPDEWNAEHTVTLDGINLLGKPDAGNGAAVEIPEATLKSEFNVVGLADTQTLTNKTLTSPIINSPALSADSVDAITEIAAALKTGSDATLVTGTAGAANNVPIWNADGDIVDGGASIADLQQTAEEIQDIAGAMVTGNTETGITVTYQDADGTIDFVTDVTKVGTPVDSQIAVWTGNGPIEGGTNFTFDGSDLVIRETVNDGNPSLQVGATASEQLHLRVIYDTGGQTVDYVELHTDVASATANKGHIRFSPDGSHVASFDDGGLDLQTGFGIAINGTDILTDSAGTATLLNIDALDATTEATIEAAIDTLANLTSAASLATVGALNSGSITSGFGAIDVGSSSIDGGNFSGNHFIASSANPFLRITETDAAADEGIWEFDAAGGQFKFHTINDAITVTANIFTVDRTGATVDKVEFPGTEFSVTGQLTCDLSAVSSTGDLAVADGGTGASTAAAAFSNLKQAATTSATGVSELATAAEAEARTDTARTTTPSSLAGFALTDELNLENLIINGDFRVAQRGTSFNSTTTPANSDDTYLLDRWILLSDGNDIFDVSQETTVVPTGSYAAIKLDVETASKRGGIVQIIEHRDAAAAIGGNVSLSFKAEKVVGNTTVDALRAVIASWTSTADTVTSDIVSAWNAEGANPTLATNWTIEGSATFTLTDSFQTFTLENVAIDTASTKNIAVLIMVENDDGTVGDLAYITDVDLRVSDRAATQFFPRPFGEEFALCKRYFEKSFSYHVAPAQNAGTSLSEEQWMAGGGAGATTSWNIRFQTEKRRPPTMTGYNPSAANAQVRNLSTGVDLTSTSFTQTGRSATRVFAAVDAGGSNTNVLIFHWAADAEL